MACRYFMARISFIGAILLMHFVVPSSLLIAKPIEPNSLPVLDPFQSKKIPYYQKLGLDTLNAGQYAEATFIYRFILRHHENNLIAQKGLARALFKQKLYSQCYEAYHQIPPGELDHESLFEFGYSAYSKQQYKAAISSLSKIPKESKFFDEANYYASHCAYNMKEYSRADSLIDQTASLPERLYDGRVALKKKIRLALIKEGAPSPIQQNPPTRPYDPRMTPPLFPGASFLTPTKDLSQNDLERKKLDHYRLHTYFSQQLQTNDTVQSRRSYMIFTTSGGFATHHEMASSLPNISLNLDTQTEIKEYNYEGIDQNLFSSSDLEVQNYAIQKIKSSGMLPIAQLELSPKLRFHPFESGSFNLDLNYFSSVPTLSWTKRAGARSIAFGYLHSFSDFELSTLMRLLDQTDSKDRSYKKTLSSKLHLSLPLPEKTKLYTTLMSSHSTYRSAEILPASPLSSFTALLGGEVEFAFNLNVNINLLIENHFQNRQTIAALSETITTNDHAIASLVNVDFTPYPWIGLRIQQRQKKNDPTVLSPPSGSTPEARDFLILTTSELTFLVNLQSTF